MWERFQIGSNRPFAKRSARMFWAASLPRKWSIRKTWRSGKYLWILSLSSRALSRSVPNGFSMMIRDSAAIPACLDELDQLQGDGRRHAHVEQPLGVGPELLLGLG